MKQIPIYKLTIREWNNLFISDKWEYPTINIGSEKDPTWVDPEEYPYYLWALYNHIKTGGKITKRIWDSLGKDSKDKLLDWNESV